MMKELQLWQQAAFDNQRSKQQTLSQRGGRRAEYLSLSIIIVCWVHGPRLSGGSYIFQKLETLMMRRRRICAAFWR